jgi:hypothetical protein
MIAEAPRRPCRSAYVAGMEVPVGLSEIGDAQVFPETVPPEQTNT